MINESSQIAAQAEILIEKEAIEEITQGMEEIAGNILNVKAIASETADEAIKGDDNLSVVVNQMNVIEKMYLLRKE